LNNNKGFLNDYAQWNIANGFPQGKLYFPMPEKYRLLNIIWQIDQPDTKLIAKTEGKKIEMHIDEKEFLREVTERVREAVGEIKKSKKMLASKIFLLSLRRLVVSILLFRGRGFKKFFFQSKCLIEKDLSK